MGTMIQLFHDKALTVLEYHQIDARVDEIIEILDSTDEIEIIEACENELDSLQETLAMSIRAAQRRERLSLIDKD